MKKVKTVFVLVLLAMAILLQTPNHVKSESNETEYTITTTVTYFNHGTIPWNLSGEDYAISLFMNDSWQSVRLLKHSLPLNSVDTDVDGNPSGFLNLTQLNPGQNASYTVVYDIVSKPRILPSIAENESYSLANISDDLKNEYCKKGESWLTDNSNLRMLAHSLAGSETRVLTIVKKLVDWIHDNIEYYSAEVPRYPNETYTLRQGDCDDQAILLITLCRILGIPAYLQIGAIYDILSNSNDTYWEGHVTSALKQIGWHGWAIVYIPPWGWLPVDLTYVLIDPNLNNPLNAIRGAAVTWQFVIQCMNFSQIDYVGTSRSMRQFMQQSDGFYIYEIDEMKMSVDFGNVWDIAELMLKGVLITTAVIAFSLAAVFVYKWKTTTKKPKFS